MDNYETAAQNRFMNKPILCMAFAALAALAASCEDGSVIERSAVKSKSKIDIDYRMYKVCGFEYKGHGYIKFSQDEGTRFGLMSVVHDPDCNKCKTKK